MSVEKVGIGPRYNHAEWTYGGQIFSRYDRQIDSTLYRIVRYRPVGSNFPKLAGITVYRVDLDEHGESGATLVRTIGRLFSEDAWSW